MRLFKGKGAATAAGPEAPAEDAAPPGYYRADYSEYAPDWIPRPDGVSPATWTQYNASRPGSRAHRAAYVGMHREVAGREFPGPDPDASYLADHGYQPDGRRPATPDDDSFYLESAGDGIAARAKAYYDHMDRAQARQRAEENAIGNASAQRYPGPEDPADSRVSPEAG